MSKLVKIYIIYNDDVNLVSYKNYRDIFSGFLRRKTLAVNLTPKFTDSLYFFKNLGLISIHNPGIFNLFNSMIYYLDEFRERVNLNGKKRLKMRLRKLFYQNKTSLELYNKFDYQDVHEMTLVLDSISQIRNKIQEEVGLINPLKSDLIYLCKQALDYFDETLIRRHLIEHNLI